MMYVSRPVVIRAVQWDGSNVEAVCQVTQNRHVDWDQAHGLSVYTDTCRVEVKKDQWVCVNASDEGSTRPFVVTDADFHRRFRAQEVF